MGCLAGDWRHSYSGFARLVFKIELSNARSTSVSDKLEDSFVCCNLEAKIGVTYYFIWFLYGMMF